MDLSQRLPALPSVPQTLPHPPPTHPSSSSSLSSRRLPPASITLPRHFHSTNTEFSSGDEDEVGSYSTDASGAPSGGGGRRRRHSYDQNRGVNTLPAQPMRDGRFNHNVNIPMPNTPGYDDEEEQV